MLNSWVKAARLHRNLTQETLGEALGVSKQNVNGWEKSRHEPSYSQLVRIAQVCGYPLPEDARLAGLPPAATLSTVGDLSVRAQEVARLFDQIEPTLQVHVEALVHALQPAGAPSITELPLLAPSAEHPPSQ